MSDTTFDPKNILEAYRTAFAPMLKAQQEGVKVFDRMGHYPVSYTHLTLPTNREV